MYWFVRDETNAGVGMLCCCLEREREMLVSLECEVDEKAKRSLGVIYRERKITMARLVKVQDLGVYSA